MQVFRERVRDNSVVYCIREKALLGLTREIGPGLQSRMPEQRRDLVIIHINTCFDHFGGVYRWG